MCCESHSIRIEMPLPTRAEVAAREAFLIRAQEKALRLAEAKAAAVRKRDADRIIEQAEEVVRLAPVFVGGELVSA